MHQYSFFFFCWAMWHFTYKYRSMPLLNYNIMITLQTFNASEGTVPLKIFSIVLPLLPNPFEVFPPDPACNLRSCLGFGVSCLFALLYLLFLPLCVCGFLHWWFWTLLLFLYIFIKCFDWGSSYLGKLQ